MAAEVRQDMVDEARKFLSNPKVFTEKEENKRAFLLKKGLTAEEISMAFSMVPKNVIINDSVSSPSLGPPVPYIPQQQSSRWSQIRDFSNFIVILSGASYGLHYIYKCYIGPLLTGRQEKSVEENMIELQQSVVAVLKDVQSTLSTLEQTLSAQTTKIQALNNEKTSDAATKHQLEELKTEITSLKGLLVNKRSFPAPPSLSAGIPSWQLSSGSSSASSAISNTIVNNTSSIASGLLNGGSTNEPTETTTITNDLSNSIVNSTSSTASGLVNGGSTNEPTETATVTNGLNVLSNITNGHSNMETENGIVDDESSVSVAVTNVSSISSTNANNSHDTQLTVKDEELESTEQDQIISHSNDLIKTDMDDTSEKKETSEDTIITDSSDEISQ